MITLDTLARIKREEDRQEVGLSKLPQSFLFEVSEYLQKKEAASGGKGSDIEYKAARQTFDYIVQRRERKILNATLSYVRSGTVPEDMTPEERELFDSVVASLQELQQKRQKEMSGEHAEMQTVAFLQDVPQFVGIDMANYGPYRTGDIATVPKENAKVIAEKGVGEIVEV